MSACRTPRALTIAISAITLAFLLSVVLLSCVASAHRPIIEDRDTAGYDDAINVSDPDVSHAIYGFLDSPNDVDFYTFDVRVALNLSIGILVPIREVYRDFRPSFAIVGPGINGTALVPFPVPPGTGVRVIDMPGNSSTFYEPFGGVDYWQSPVSHTWLNQSGRYYVVVFDRSHMRGDYTLAIGERELFPIADLPGSLLAVLRIRAGVWDHSKIVSGTACPKIW